MSEKNQFFREEIEAYSDLFQERSIKRPDQLGGKEGVPLEIAAAFILENTYIPWDDIVHMLSRVVSAVDADQNEAQIRH